MTHPHTSGSALSFFLNFNNERGWQLHENYINGFSEKMLVCPKLGMVGEKMKGSQNILNIWLNYTVVSPKPFYCFFWIKFVVRKMSRYFVNNNNNVCCNDLICSCHFCRSYTSSLLKSYCSKSFMDSSHNFLGRPFFLFPVISSSITSHIWEFIPPCTT